ncbi:MAG: hypothetical protein UX10_C0007G0005 [Candidatus Magasanikbacteria bacterium GW2011_GWA2_45_39]|uniref:Uncharacterized protein n=1 Tax=Candidatus Magasanikbacteria bacterium GW2011_GWA2_45_39 TaxID=1619041 RepID=A0A0G1MHK7_9BACT|nr:MAG: hypothetical protein UX10_C0007G0005 [Candidatus Magasanikbacteria bacterium GW2011_GWA2_45_39]
MFFAKFVLCACAVSAALVFSNPPATAETAERNFRVERIPIEPPPPLYLMVRNLPVSVKGFGQYSFTTSSDNKGVETGFDNFWLMAEIAPCDTVTMSVIPNLASRSVVEAVTRIHAPGSWIGFQFGKFRGPFQQMMLRPDKELVVGGARAGVLTIPFPLGAEVFMKFHSVKLYVSAFSDDAKGSLNGQQVTNGNARVSWKVNKHLTLEQVFLTGHYDENNWVARAGTRVGYTHERLKVEMLSVYEIMKQSDHRAWGASFAAAYRLAEQWEASCGYDHVVLAKDPAATDEFRLQVTFIPLGEHLRVAAQYGYASLPLHKSTLQLQTNF